MKTDWLKVAEASSAPGIKSEHLKNKSFSVALVQEGRAEGRVYSEESFYSITRYSEVSLDNRV